MGEREGARNLNAKTAAAVMSYNGILRYCNSYNFRKRYLYPIISIKKCKEAISYESRIRRMPAAVQG